MFLVGPGGHVVGINQASGSRRRTRCMSRATSSSRRPRPTCWSSPRRARRGRRSGSRRLPPRPQLRADEGSCRPRRIARRCSTRCRWRSPAAPTRTTSPPRASSRRRASPRSRRRSARSSQAATPASSLGDRRRARPSSRCRRSRRSPGTGRSTPAPFAPPALPTPVFAGVGTIAFGTYASPDYETPAKVIPAVGTATGRRPRRRRTTSSSRSSCRRGRAGRRLARRDLRPRVHRLEERRALGRRGHARTQRDRDDRDQRRRPRLRRGRHVHRRAQRRRAGDAAGGRARHRPGRQRRRSTRPRASTRSAPQYAHRQPRRAPPDGDRHDAARARSSRPASTSTATAQPTSARRASTTPGSRSAASTARSCSGSSRTSARASRTSPAARSSRSPGCRRRSGRSSGSRCITRTPSLYNNPAPERRSCTNFNENMPLRNLPLVVDTVPGATPIANLIDNTEWAQQAATRPPTRRTSRSPVIFQFARGDQTVPNPTTSAILRACGCADRATLFRNDLARPAFGTSENPHTFLTNIVGPARRSRSPPSSRSRRSSPPTARRRSTRTAPGVSSRRPRRWCLRTSASSSKPCKQAIRRAGSPPARRIAPCGYRQRDPRSFRFPAARPL